MEEDFMRRQKRGASGVAQQKNHDAEHYTTILEQWKTCVEMADSNTEKRNSSNGLFITINLALFAVVTFAWDHKSILLSLIGIVVCTLWLYSIRCYRQLSSVKYHIINEMEKKLPIKPFTDEWQELRNRHNYLGLTKIEWVLPWTFIVLYSLSVLCPICWYALSLVCPCIGK